MSELEFHSLGFPKIIPRLVVLSTFFCKITMIRTLKTVLLSLIAFMLVFSLNKSPNYGIQERIYYDRSSSDCLPRPLFYDARRIEVADERVIRRYQSLESIFPEIPNDKQNFKTILFYSKNYGEDYIQRSWNWTTDGTFYYPSNSAFHCPRNCKVTMDKTQAEHSHGIVFSILDTIYHTKRGELKYPKMNRNPNQIWIASIMEPPIYHNLSFLHKLGTLFNWTMSYRLDSDLYYPSGFFHKLEKRKEITEIELPDPEILKAKKLGAALISNCGANSNRDALIGEMKKVLREVDVYGKCGISCPVQDCRQYLGTKYKFLFAFENSLCQDYITEKFFDSIRVGVVPVTYGLGDYTQIAPPHSYINALDFPNIQTLSNYLKYLDKNDEAYLKYFHWKMDYELAHRPQDMSIEICIVCMKLWEPTMYTQRIKNIAAWWNHKRKGMWNGAKVLRKTRARSLLNASATSCVSPTLLHKIGYFTKS